MSWQREQDCENTVTPCIDRQSDGIQPASRAHVRPGADHAGIAAALGSSDERWRMSPACQG